MMPPKRKQRSAKEIKEDAERQQKILYTKEKILSIRRMILTIVESMIERDVSKRWFLTNCVKLCQDDYNDVVQERSIGNLCGYPLCSNNIKQTLRQKYRISLVTNKVYDLTERKCFCSNQCYKASNYLKAQLSSIALHLRKEEERRVHLLSDCDNKGSAGEEIQFHHTIPKEEINKVYNNEQQVINNFQNMLNEEVKKCADSLSELKIKENVFQKQYVFGDKIEKKSALPVYDAKNEDSDTDTDSDDSVDENFFPNYDNVNTLSHKHMPVPEKVKKTVLIPHPLLPEMGTTSLIQDLSLGFVSKVFKDWMTEDSLKYLIGEKYVYGIKADNLFERMTESDPINSEKLASIKNEYIQLCLKIDSLPDDDDISDAELDILSGPRTENTPKKAESGDSSSVKKVFKRRPRKSKEKSKRVSFSSENKEKDNQSTTETADLPDGGKTVSSVVEKVELHTEEKIVPSSTEKTDLPFERKVEQSAKEKIDMPTAEKDKVSVEEKVKLLVGKQNEQPNSTINNEAGKERPPIEDPLSEPALPLVDSVAQNALRRKVLIGHLKSVYIDLLPIVDLHYTVIREAVRKFVDTLSLTPTNIIFKPKEWKLISLVLFRILTRTVLKDIHDELQFAKLCEAPLMPIAIGLREIENLVGDILSAENIINIQ